MQSVIETRSYSSAVLSLVKASSEPELCLQMTDADPSFPSTVSAGPIEIEASGGAALPHGKSTVDASPVEQYRHVPQTT